MQYWSLTDPGCVRTQNQDACEVHELDKSTTLFVVCDGMGGARSGNVASSLAAEVFSQEIRRNYRKGMTNAQVDELLKRAVKLANFTVYDQSCQFEDFHGMGTTLVAGLLRGRQITLVNVGDSRAYRIWDGDIQQLTVDHSLVQTMVSRGELRPELARSFPGKNYITRAIGTESAVQCDLFHYELERGDCLLLCSDGLTNLVDDQEILFEIVYGGGLPDCCRHLLDIALNRGAPDNVTSILVQV